MSANLGLVHFLLNYDPRRLNPTLDLLDALVELKTSDPDMSYFLSKHLDLSIVAREDYRAYIPELMLNLASLGFDVMVEKLHTSDCAHWLSSLRFLDQWEDSVQERFDDAIQEGIVDVAEHLLRYGANIHGSPGRISYFKAIEWHQLGTLKFLLRNELPSDSLVGIEDLIIRSMDDEDGPCTPLIKFLLDLAPPDFVNCLLPSIIGGDMLRLVFDCFGIKLQPGINAQHHALDNAVLAADTDIIKRFLHAGFDVNERYHGEEHQPILLDLAADSADPLTSLFL